MQIYIKFYRASLVKHRGDLGTIVIMTFSKWRMHKVLQLNFSQFGATNHETLHLSTLNCAFFQWKHEPGLQAADVCFHLSFLEPP